MDPYFQGINNSFLADTETHIIDAPIAGKTAIAMDIPMKYGESQCRYVFLVFNHDTSINQLGRMKDAGGTDAMHCVSILNFKNAMNFWSLKFSVTRCGANMRWGAETLKNSVI